MELAVDSFVAYFYPDLLSQLIRALEELGAEQDPPFSKGVYFFDIRKRFWTYSFINRTLFTDMCEPIFTVGARHDHVFIDENFAKFSTVRINENYRTFSENLALRWPGYMMAKSAHILPKTDTFVHLDDLLALLRSKDLQRYQR